MRRVLLGIAMVWVMSAGCASAAGTSRGVSAPTMLSNSRPDWRLPPGRPAGVVLDLRITVRVDAAGRPNMETLTITGLGASDNREVAAAWLQSARFRPAQQAGQAVEGLFQTRIQARSQVRRVGSDGSTPDARTLAARTPSHRTSVLGDLR